MSDLHIEGWSGPVPSGPAGRALLAAVAPVLAGGVGRAVQEGRASDAIWTMLGHPRCERLIADTLLGWATPSGDKVTDATVRGWGADELMEAAGVALAVWTASGFFGRDARSRYLASLTETTPGSD